MADPVIGRGASLCVLACSLKTSGTAQCPLPVACTLLNTKELKQSSADVFAGENAALVDCAWQDVLILRARVPNTQETWRMPRSGAAPDFRTMEPRLDRPANVHVTKAFRSLSLGVFPIVHLFIGGP